MAEKPPENQNEIKAEDIASQIMVVRTKDNQIAVQYPTVVGAGAPDIAEALYLYAAGLNTLANMMRQQQEAMAAILTPPEKKIVLAPAIPKEFLTKGKL